MKYNIQKHQNGNSITYITPIKTYPEPRLKKYIDDNFDIVKKIYTQARKSGLSDEQATGLLGNKGKETGGTFDPEQKQIRGPGIGLIQHEKGTLRYNRMLENTYNFKDLGEQVNYILSNFLEENSTNSQDVWGGTGKQDIWWNSDHSTPEKSAEITSNLYIRPNKKDLKKLDMKERKAISRYIFEKLGNHKIVSEFQINPFISPQKTLDQKLNRNPKKWINLNDYKSYRPPNHHIDFKKQGGTINYNIANILSIWEK